MNIHNMLSKLHWFFIEQFGIDPRKTIRSLWSIPRYVRDLFRFRSSYIGRLRLLPCLHDWYEEGGTTKSEYFWQDLLVARMISAAKPEKHVDIGSRVDGFVAHVASFREIEVFDVRPITAQVAGIVFKQADLMRPVALPSADGRGYCDSLSCLHALEHFGLGRYGDPIDPMGPERGFANMASLLRKDGVFYLSIPIGMARVYFNAERVFDPQAVIKLAEEHCLRLCSLTIIKQGGNVTDFSLVKSQLTDLANQKQSLGIFTFVKTA